MGRTVNVANLLLGDSILNTSSDTMLRKVLHSIRGIIIIDVNLFVKVLAKRNLYGLFKQIIIKTSKK